MIVAKKHKLNIQLKNFKHFAQGSEDSYCFQASIWMNGVKVGQASDNGMGGSVVITPDSLRKELDAHGKTLPKYKSALDEDGLDVSGEIIINDLVTEILALGDLKRLLKRGVLITCRNETLLSLIKVKGTVLEGANSMVVKDFVKTHYKANQVLNYMGEADAFAAYLKAEKSYLADYLD